MLRTDNDICNLDYLVGTLATAYRGAITALVVKDFCMSDKNGTATLRGTILSIPTGDYEASLIQSGNELSRTGLVKGHFELTADSGRIAEARDLQIDIIQTGRHIGTFLLKKENAGGLYLSAVELSEELSGLDLTRLTTPFREKTGLLQKAEELVSLIHSTKKDWTIFSNKLNGFARDFYWSDREAFSRASEILAHFALLAAERAAPDDKSKAVSNYFDLLEVPLEHERDQSLLRSIAGTWVAALSRSSLDLSTQAGRAVTAIRALSALFPGLDTSAAMAPLVRSLTEKSSQVIVLPERLVHALEGLIAPGERDALSRFGEEGRRRMEQGLAGTRKFLEAGEPGRALDLLAEADLEILDDRKAVSLLFDVVGEILTKESAGLCSEVVAVLLSFAGRMSAAALTAAGREVPRIIDALVAIQASDACAVLLRRLQDLPAPIRDRVLLDPRVARSLYRSSDGRLKSQYEEAIKEIIIPAARVRGISPETWSELVPPLHFERLNAFLDLLMTGEEQPESLLIHVAANLALSNVLIPDDRLFQRRISAYLNSKAMQGSFLMNYLLLRSFPVYFNEVGATSRIRDYSTELDSWADDPVIYFVRKQVHVNASSYNVRLLEQVIRCWMGNDLSILKPVVPPDIYAQANPRLIQRYSGVMSSFFRSMNVQDSAGLHLDRLLAIPDEAIDGAFGGGEGDGEARAKVSLLCKLYKEIVLKYSLIDRDSPTGDIAARLSAAIERLRELKSVVLSPEKTAPQESLYFKRHIAFGIPSVLGTYHERKFDALKEMMCYGEEIPVLLQAALPKVEKGEQGAEQADALHWKALSDAWEVLKLYGMENVLIDEYVDVLAHYPLHRAQKIDVLKLFQKELAWMVASLGRTFHGPLAAIVAKIPPDDLPEQLMNLGPASVGFVDKASDAVMRDILNSVPGLVECDRLLETLVHALRIPEVRGGGQTSERRRLPKGPKFYDIQALSFREARSLGPELGNKAKNLVYLKDKGLPVPAGIVLPAHLEADFNRALNDDAFKKILQKAVGALEAKTNATFGGGIWPLFLSVRSGSYLSMPGVLSSILYCGMNDHTVEAFIRQTGDDRLGWDSYRRFIEHYGTAVLGLKIEFFEKIRAEYRNAPNWPENLSQAGKALSGLVSLYKSRLAAVGLVVPDDAFEQLQHCVRAVYASWNSVLAGQYRRATGISEHWGTAVLLMEMVSGNREGGGSSVFFTREPATLLPVAYGETLENSSGDDLVSGRKSGRPLSRIQATTGGQSLEESDPELYRLHRELARKIEDVFKGIPQEVEATYTRDAAHKPVLWALQARRMEQDEALFKTFDEICGNELRVIGRGIGAHGGALSGVASFATLIDSLERLGKQTGAPIILLRKTANTADVSFMPFVRGIITSSGGVTSHAAVLAQKFGLTAVVACSDLQLLLDDRGRPYAELNGMRVEEGTPISIDGADGLVFSGACFEQTSGS